MTWADPVGDLRTLLCDGPTDKISAFKKVFGNTNNSNLVFKTFEFRRQNDFTAASSMAPVGLYLNGVLLPASAVTMDDVVSGFFSVNFAVKQTDLFQSTYYYTWFLDSELQTFLRLASNWVGQSDDYTLTPDGLKSAVSKYAMYQAYSKVALKYAIDPARTYRLEDDKDAKGNDMVKNFTTLSKTELDNATVQRDDFYTRKGQAKAPISRTIRGNVRQPTVS